MKLILGFVVFVAVVVNTCVMNHIIRRTTAEDARKSITKTNTLTASLLVSPKDALLSSLVIRDQAVTKIASQIYTVIRDDYPEMDLKAVSVHLIPKTRYSDQIWNFVQVGRETRDMEHLDRVKKDGSPGSLIAAAIINNRPVYCADVRRLRLLSTADCGQQRLHRHCLFPDTVPTEKLADFRRNLFRRRK
jgi:hypothetical protein